MIFPVMSLQINARTRALLAQRNLDIHTFSDAANKAFAIWEPIRPNYQYNARILMNVAMAYKAGGKLMDIGGGYGEYLLILRLLGMEVTSVDFAFLQPDPTFRKVFEDHGIRMVAGDLYAFARGEAPGGDAWKGERLEGEQFDVVSCYECLEHLPHSPKSVMRKITSLLAPGGRFVMSVPNIARIENRTRLLKGRTVHEKFAELYHDGEPYFAGHHHEYTIAEVKWMLAENQLLLQQLFTTDVTVQSLKRRSAWKRALNALNYTYQLTDKITPVSLRKHIWAESIKTV
jgi:2-polyprenyl-3-methyl-5-hydroxy-6-metoxy-1,4-benzoquinol methylase